LLWIVGGKNILNRWSWCFFCNGGYGLSVHSEIWHYFHGADQRCCEEILAALAKAGVRSHPLDQHTPQGPGILFFNGISPELCQLAREFSHNGVDRIIAVSVSRSPLDSGLWNILKAGAADVFVWDGANVTSEGIVRRFERWHQVDKLLDSSLVTENLVGMSLTWRTVLRQLIEIAHFTDSPILITGESGTGKELAARLVHTLDKRTNKHDLVVLDCTTVVPSLSGSEFFGHERGAFTGAVSSRDGAFAMADGGTLFLDEVGDLPLELQAQLLRVVQEKTYKRVGGNSWQKTDFRLLCATNRDLLDEVREGKFRNDLYYRIAAWVCRLPPLRERRDDIIPLARHFMRQMRPDEVPPELDKAVADFLVRRNYPGNVRDLKQLVTRITVMWGADR
jgi:DNA-binding NtrC family response regulator